MYGYIIYVYRYPFYDLAETTDDPSVIDAYITNKNKDYERLLVVRYDKATNAGMAYVMKLFDSLEDDKNAPKQRVRRPIKPWEKRREEDDKS